MRLASRRLSRSQREETGKVEIEILEKEILGLKGKRREEAMRAYRRFLLSSADQLVFFMRS